MTSEQNYPGYEELTSYLTRSRDKSFWGFLRRCRDTIVATAQATSRRQDLEGDWVRNFLSEARKLGEDLKGKVNSERQRVKNKLETYWNNIIEECKIKKDILDHEAEISRLKRKLFEIQENTKMQNSSNQEDLVNEGPDDHDILMFDDGDDNINDDDIDDGDDNINNDDNSNIDNVGEDNNNNNNTISLSSPAVATTSTTTNNNSNDNTTISSSLAVVTTTPSESYNLRSKRPINYNYGHVTKKRKKNKSSPLTQPLRQVPSRQLSPRQPSPLSQPSRQLSPRQPSPLSRPSRQVPSQQPSPRQPSPSYNDFNFFDDVSGGNNDNNECTGGCPKHCRDD